MMERRVEGVTEDAREGENEDHAARAGVSTAV